MVATTTVANANEIMPRSAMVNGASPFTMIVAGTDPTPTKTRNAVPSASAASFWVSDGSSIDVLLRSRSKPAAVWWSTISDIIR
jgi:hypothetical protein